MALHRGAHARGGRRHGTMDEEPGGPALFQGIIIGKTIEENGMNLNPFQIVSPLLLFLSSNFYEP
ncbi:putative inner membrane protein [Sesbania bispinosa]|nr:putative inner membrane protein [Sesbania bispinosa]